MTTCESCQAREIFLAAEFRDGTLFLLCKQCTDDLVNAAAMLLFDLVLTAPPTLGTQLALV